MADVLDVAQEVLNRVGETSTWKLQKLVYYCQAWHCVWADKPLFNAKIQAWANGPVCPDLYIKHRGEFSVSELRGADPSRLTRGECDTIERVVEFYKVYNGQQLSDLTHMEEPWKRAREGLTPNERGDKEITLESMAEYYGGLGNGTETQKTKSKH